MLDLKVPPPLVAIAVGVLMWALGLPGIGVLWPRSGWLLLAGGFIALAGGFVSAAGIIAFRRARTTVNPLKPRDALSLVTAGIYAFTRNPMYLGLLLVLVGWAVYLGNAISALALLVFPAYMTRFQIRPEERVLLSLFGDEYARYAARVRRWF